MLRSITKARSVHGDRLKFPKGILTCIVKTGTARSVHGYRNSQTGYIHRKVLNFSLCLFLSVRSPVYSSIPCTQVWYFDISSPFRHLFIYLSASVVSLTAACLLHAYLSIHLSVTEPVYLRTCLSTQASICQFQDIQALTSLSVAAALF